MYVGGPYTSRKSGQAPRLMHKCAEHHRWKEGANYSPEPGIPPAHGSNNEFVRRVLCPFIWFARSWTPGSLEFLSFRALLTLFHAAA